LQQSNILCKFFNVDVNINAQTYLRPKGLSPTSLNFSISTPTTNLNNIVRVHAYKKKQLCHETIKSTWMQTFCGYIILRAYLAKNCK
jgi:hypothetical protein